MREQVLVGAEVSLYTGKLRCYLRYKQIPFKQLLATQEVYKTVIIPRTGVRYIPILITDDDFALQDTTEIIDFLENRYPTMSVYPESPLQHLIALLLEIYGDEWLVIPAMHYRWNYAENREFAWQEFGYTAIPNATRDEQYQLGKKLAEPFAGALPMLGVTDEAIGAIEQSYLALLTDLNNHFKEHAFLLGGIPCIADFGLIGPLYAHLYRDPCSKRLLGNHAPYVAEWVSKMVAGGCRSGRLLPGDQVPATLWRVLQRMFSEQGPVIEQTLKQVKEWAANHNEREIPRAVGSATFNLAGQEFKRLTFPYMQWMWQRAADYYQQLNTAERKSVDAAMVYIPGAIDLLNNPIAVRLERVKNRLLVMNK